METGRKAYGLKDYDTAIQQAEVALANKSPDEAAKIKNEAQMEIAAQAERERKYKRRWRRAKAHGLKDYDTAIQQAEVALANKSPDEAATKLKNEAQMEIAGQAERGRKYQAAMETAGRRKPEGLRYGDPAGGRGAFDRVWRHGATKLKNEAQMEIAARAERERKYQAAMENGWKATA